jgi:hypothetical protein
MEDLHALLQHADHFSEEEICAKLSQRLEALFLQDGEAFYALLYRLDISERKVAAAMAETAPMALIARLIYQRQLEKARLRRQFGRNDSTAEDDPDLKW